MSILGYPRHKFKNRVKKTYHPNDSKSKIKKVLKKHLLLPQETNATL